MSYTIDWIARGRILTIGALLLSVCFLTGHAHGEEAEEQVPSTKCIKALQSNCNATQEELIKELLQDLEKYGTERAGRLRGRIYSDAPALELLPKDSLGMVNWNRAVTDGLIRPKGTLTEEPEKQYEGFLDNIIVFQAKVYLMADVAFPHGMHSYWVGCDSCHPEPFKKEAGANKMNMTEIFAGKWCGKCHGKVAFPATGISNCKRCHAISKHSLIKETFK
ncbi:hypothetical protein MNBD_GAMMA26-2392 [hydrothermal vent metagenome]|uniref:Cytochrome c7-like domain-containing protein n=1 Tax=hydrothermal vent metagenome TaxID=652676 RepID=A0A3B1BW57_9ZZZZ